MMPLILDLQDEWNKAKTDPEFQAELAHLGTHYIVAPARFIIRTPDCRAGWREGLFQAR